MRAGSGNDMGDNTVSGRSGGEAYADLFPATSGFWASLCEEETQHVAMVESMRRFIEQHGLSRWDAQIVAAARHAGCRYLLTEDFQDG